MSKAVDISKTTKCNHRFMSSIQTNNLHICQTCGVIKYKEKTTTKPYKFNYECVIDPFEQMERTKIKLFEDADINLEINEGYTANRKGLIKYIKLLVEKFRFQESIYFLSIIYMDTIMMNNTNPNGHVIAYCCFLLASKFYECDPKFPIYKELKASSINGMTPYELKSYELYCLRMLNYNLDRCTPLFFLELYLKNGIVFEEESPKLEISNLYAQTTRILRKIIKDPRFFDFNSIQIASALVKISREAQRLEGWPKYFEQIYQTRVEDFMNCYFVIKTLFANNDIKYMNDKRMPERNLFFEDINPTNTSYRTHRPIYTDNLQRPKYFNEIVNSTPNYNYFAHQLYKVNSNHLNNSDCNDLNSTLDEISDKQLSDNNRQNIRVNSQMNYNCNNSPFTIELNPRLNGRSCKFRNSNNFNSNFFEGNRKHVNNTFVNLNNPFMKMNN